MLMNDTIGDNDVRVSDITVGRLIDLVSMGEQGKRLSQLMTEYQSRLSDLKQIQERSTQVFADTEKLAAVSTVFRVSSEDELQKLLTSLREGFDQGSVFLMAVAAL